MKIKVGIRKSLRILIEEGKFQLDGQSGDVHGVSNFKNCWFAFLDYGWGFNLVDCGFGSNLGSVRAHRGSYRFFRDSSWLSTDDYQRYFHRFSLKILWKLFGNAFSVEISWTKHFKVFQPLIKIQKNLKILGNLKKN